ncbi:hypothetical protein BN1723_014736, partial [Verticillium longisporum]
MNAGEVPGGICDSRSVGRATAISSALAPPLLTELPSRRAIAELVGLNPADADTDTTPGDWGYLNGNSGWADAGRSMQWLLARVQATGRVRFVHGTATALLRSGDRVTGARLADASTLLAALVIVATGAWTGALVDLAGQAVATGQVLAYVDVTPTEAAALRHLPIVLNLSTGLFVIPPARGQLKVARHGYGYADLRRVLRATVPLPQLHDRPFAAERICWYTDTPTGDFLVDYHPGWRGLFLATAGSGHGFKFLPIIGDHVVDCVEGRRPEAFDDKWRWRGVERTDDDVEQVYEHIVTEDGSRGGKSGLVLAEELTKNRRAKM